MGFSPEIAGRAWRARAAAGVGAVLLVLAGAGPARAASAPVVKTAPSITGTARDGSVLQGNVGLWSGTPPITFSVWWRRCDSTGAGCRDIPGATSTSYRLTSADVGMRIRFEVTATNAGGSTSASSPASAPVAPIPPVSTSAPSISGSALDGGVLKAAVGTWSGTTPMAFAYRWRRCDAVVCSDVLGATGSTYALGAADVGWRIAVVVTATNAAGSTSATSGQTGVVAPAPPRNVAAPAVSGTPRDGQTLRADPGTWTGTEPLSFAYQWQRCTTAGCADIGGATRATLTLGPADVGASVRVAVTATNAADSTIADSAAIGPVQALAPASTTAPAISGTPRDGETLGIDPGSWSGTPPLSFAYEWQRCLGGVCSAIPGATDATYVATAADVGATLRAAVTASNDAGSATAVSAETETVAAAPPRAQVAPSVGGVARDEQTLTADPGGWSGTPPISFAYAWQRCDPAGAACTAIAGATSRGYRLTPADVGSTIRVAVTATNAGGTADALSAPTSAVVPAPPASVAAPAVTGSARQFDTLTATKGRWTGTPLLSYSYRWQRCDAHGLNCAIIPTATLRTYTLTSADIGATIRAHVTASNVAGSVVRNSAVTPAVAGICGAAAQPPAAWRHVVWIWMENKPFDGIIGNTADAPFENQLATDCGLATGYTAVTHPSLPNYIAATSGDTQGITDDQPPSYHPLGAPSIFSLVADAGLQWRAYEESAPGPCQLVPSSPYAVKHDPAPYYTGVRAACALWDVPMGTASAGAMASDLDTGSLPAFTFVTPNTCNDTHNCPISSGDKWLSTWIRRLVMSPNYRSGDTAIFLTWDEDDNSEDNHVPTIVISPSTPRGAAPSTPFDHYSLLRTTEEMLGLSPLLGHAADAASMRQAFGL